MSKSFIDKEAKIGRPSKAPESETIVYARSNSRSIPHIEQSLKCEIKDSNLTILVKPVVSDKIRILKRDAINFANWILETLDKPKRTRDDRKEANLARKSKTNRVISPVASERE